MSAQSAAVPGEFRDGTPPTPAGNRGSAGNAGNAEADAPDEPDAPSGAGMVDTDVLPVEPAGSEAGAAPVELAAGILAGAALTAVGDDGAPPP